jgi:sulfate permease, SulP family
VVIVMAVSQLLKIKEARQLWSIDRKDFWMMIITFGVTLLLGIGPGIGIGVLLSLAWIVFEASYPHHAELGRVPGTHSFRNVRRFKDLETLEGVLIFRFDAPLFFANADRFREVLAEYKNHHKDPVHSIIIDMESINTIDSSALEAFSDLIDAMARENIHLMLSEVKGPVRDKLFRSGLTHKLGQHNFFVTTEDAYQHIAGKKNDPASDVALQTNVLRR